MRSYNWTPEGRAKFVAQVSKRMTGVKPTPETIEKRRLANIGRKHTAEARQRMSVAQKLKWATHIISPEERLRRSTSAKGRKHSEEAKLKMSKAHTGKKLTAEHRQKIKLARSGEKSNFWRGGVSPINRRIRGSREYKLWRQAVLERDSYVCIWCGETEGQLDVDHIKPFAHYPELRFAIDNGRTLCVKCHQTTDTFGYKSNHPKP